MSNKPLLIWSYVDPGLHSHCKCFPIPLKCHPPNIFARNTADQWCPSVDGDVPGGLGQIHMIWPWNFQGMQTYKILKRNSMMNEHQGHEGHICPSRIWHLPLAALALTIILVTSRSKASTSIQKEERYEGYEESCCQIKRYLERKCDCVAIQ